MTSESDFQAALNSAPDDWQTLLVFSDWLREQGDRRADGYLAMGRARLVARCLNKGQFDSERWVWWDADCYSLYSFPAKKDDETSRAMLPADWFGLIPLARTLSKSFPTRQQAMDAAATTFSNMSPERQAQLLKQVDVSSDG